jgi:hypothetical protein
MANILRLIEMNIPLYKHASYDERRGDGYGFSAGGKNPGKIAKSIHAQLSHPETVRLVTRDFDTLPEQVRIELRTLCADTNASGNVRKGVQALNNALGGKLLSSEKGRVMNRRHETANGVAYRQMRVNPAIAGAHEKYSIVKK